MPETVAPPQNLNLPTKRVGLLDVPILDKPYTKILEAVKHAGCRLNMTVWHGDDTEEGYEELSPIEHFCGTVHCIAGWANHLCGLQGFILESRLNDDPECAAEMILEASSDLDRPDFMSSDDEAMAELEMLAALEAQ